MILSTTGAIIPFSTDLTCNSTRLRNHHTCCISPLFCSLFPAVRNHNF